MSPEVKIIYSLRRKTGEKSYQGKGPGPLAFWKITELYSNYENQCLEIPMGLQNKQHGQGESRTTPGGGGDICWHCSVLSSAVPFGPHGNTGRQIFLLLGVTVRETEALRGEATWPRWNQGWITQKPLSFPNCPLRYHVVSEESPVLSFWAPVSSP